MARMTKIGRNCGIIQDMMKKSCPVNTKSLANKYDSDDPLGLKGFPRKKANKEAALRAARAIRKEIDEYIRDYNLPFPSLR